jgi:uncharacterized protein YciI
MKKLALAVLMLAAACLCAPAQQPTPSAAPAATAPAKPMKTWFVRIIPPRPTFDKDMTDAEGEAMQKHFVYWKGLNDKGVCLFGGPVLDARGVFGIIVLAAATEDEAKAIVAADPSVVAGVNKVEVAEMEVAFVPKHKQGPQ